MRTASRFHRIGILTGVFVLLAGASSALSQATDAATEWSRENILRQLQERSGAARAEYILRLSDTAGTLPLSEPDIDAILAVLREIEQADPFSKEVFLKGALTVYPARSAANAAGTRFRGHVLSARVRALPVVERVQTLMRWLKDPAQKEYGMSEFIVHELAATGSAAVPLIMAYEPDPYHYTQTVMRALGRIGDPRAVDYLIRVLRMPLDKSGLLHAEAAEQLGKFCGERVLRALIDALRDESYETIDQNQGQAGPLPGHTTFPARFCRVRQQAAESLVRVAKYDPGPLFREDFKTWDAWYACDVRATFDPATVPRSDAELAGLLENLFHRYMSEPLYPLPPEDPPNTGLASDESVVNLARGLKSQGPHVVERLLAAYRARVHETPVWESQLKSWTRRVLLAMQSEEARRAAGEL